jgi:hypothetical protein
MNLEVSSCTKYFGTGDQEVREYRSQEIGKKAPGSPIRNKPEKRK